MEGFQWGEGEEGFPIHLQCPPNSHPLSLGSEPSGRGRNLGDRALAAKAERRSRDKGSTRCLQAGLARSPGRSSADACPGQPSCPDSLPCSPPDAQHQEGGVCVARRPVGGLRYEARGSMGQGRWSAGRRSWSTPPAVCHRHGGVAVNLRHHPAAGSLRPALQALGRREERGTRRAACCASSSPSATWSPSGQLPRWAPEPQRGGAVQAQLLPARPLLIRNLHSQWITSFPPEGGWSMAPSRAAR